MMMRAIKEKIVQNLKKKYRGECDELCVGNRINYMKKIILNMSFEG